MGGLALYLAAAAIVAIGLVHSVLGERWLIGPLLSPEFRRGMLAKSEFARRTLRFAWHITTLAWWGIAVVVVLLAQSSEVTSQSAVFFTLATMFVLTGAVTLVVSRGRHLAWPVFFGIGALLIVPVYLPAS